jgi:hypothetical protein
MLKNTHNYLAKINKAKHTFNYLKVTFLLIVLLLVSYY